MTKKGSKKFDIFVVSSPGETKKNAIPHKHDRDGRKEGIQQM